MAALKITLIVIITVTSILLTLTILMHKGKGGGLSDMFGGGISSSAGKSNAAIIFIHRLETIGRNDLHCLDYSGFCLRRYIPVQFRTDYCKGRVARKIDSVGIFLSKGYTW